MSLTVQRYQAEATGEWNEFVARSRNGTFLIQREYMDYHSARFLDHSLLIRDAGGRLLALLPANEHDGGLSSHGGLTYGGLILGSRSGAADVLKCLEAVMAYTASQCLRALHYKTIPWIYHRQPSDDDRYAL